MGQCNVFVRNRELLAREPFSIMADEPFVEELTELVTRLALGGLLKANPNLIDPNTPDPMTPISAICGRARRKLINTP
jgi:hypothetical protein